MRFWLITRLIGFFALTSCYDGWEVGDGGSNSSPLPPGSERAIYQIQFVTFSLAKSALSDPACFDATGTELFRQAEWEERIAEIDTQMKDLAVTYEMQNIEINANDCINLQAITDKAIDPTYMDSLGDDELDRPIVHLAAAFWNGDVPGNPAPQISQQYWASPKKLKDRGRRVETLYYFSQSNEMWGKLGKWILGQRFWNKSHTLYGTPINQVDPTPTGRDNRKQIAIKDAQAVAAWINQVATSL